MTKKLANVLLLILITVIYSCSSNTASSRISEKGKHILNKVWVYQIEEMDVEVENVTSQADQEFNMSKSIVFMEDPNDSEKLIFNQSSKRGMLVLNVVGSWHFENNEKELVLQQENAEGNEHDIRYEVEKLTETKMIIKKEGALAPDVYILMID